MDLPARLSDEQKYILIYVTRRRYPSITWLVRHIVAEFSDERFPPTAAGVQVTDSERASVSRSLRRLEERGLLLRLARPRIADAHQLGLPVSLIPERTPTYAVIASSRGQRVGEELFRRVKDGRYSLDFSTVDT